MSLVNNNLGLSVAKTSIFRWCALTVEDVIAVAACVTAAGIYMTTNLNVGAIILNNERETVFKNSHFTFLFFCQVRDVSALAELSSLQTLNLDGTSVTEGSLEHLASHPTLSSLSLAGVPVADGNQALQIISGKLFQRKLSSQWNWNKTVQVCGESQVFLLSLQV